MKSIVEIYLPLLVLGVKDEKETCVNVEPESMLQVGEHVLAVALKIVLDDVLDICRSQYFLNIISKNISSDHSSVEIDISRLESVLTVPGIKFQVTSSGKITLD